MKHPDSIYAKNATVGSQYVTKGGHAVTVIDAQSKAFGRHAIAVRNDLTHDVVKIDPSQLLWPYRKELISKEAIEMAKQKRTTSQSKRKVLVDQKLIGKTFTRLYKGKTYKVTVTEDGFRYAGQLWRSISGLATKLAGTPTSGPTWFGMRKMIMIAILLASSTIGWCSGVRGNPDVYPSIGFDYQGARLTGTETEASSFSTINAASLTSNRTTMIGDLRMPINRYLTLSLGGGYMWQSYDANNIPGDFVQKFPLNGPVFKAGFRVYLH